MRIRKKNDYPENYKNSGRYENPENYKNSENHIHRKL